MGVFYCSNFHWCEFVLNFSDLGDVLAGAAEEADGGRGARAAWEADGGRGNGTAEEADGGRGAGAAEEADGGRSAC